MGPEFLPCLLLPVVAIALLLLGGWGLTVDRVVEACCRECRYPTQGLAGHTCPECGADLRGEGTRGPGARIVVQPPVGVALICRTILIAIPTLVCLAIAAEEFPRLEANVSASARSSTGLFRSLSVSGGGARNTANHRYTGTPRVPRDHLVVTLEGPKRSVTLRVRDACIRISYDAPGGGRVRTADGMTEADILAWFQASGIDPSSAEAGKQAAAVATLIRHCVVGGGDMQDGSPGGGFEGLAGLNITSDVHRSVRPLIAAAVLIPALVVWCLLVRPLARRSGRSREAAP